MRETIPWRHNMAALNSPEGTLAEFFNSHFFESSQFTLPALINTTTKKTSKESYAQDCGIWRWNTRGGKVLLSIHMTNTPGFGIAWSSWNCSISRKEFLGSWKHQGHSTGILVALYEMWAMGRNLAGRAALFTGSYRLRQKYSPCTLKLPVICLCVLIARIRLVMWWIHIEDIFTIDAEFVLDKWTMMNDDTNFL